LFKISIQGVSLWHFHVLYPKLVHPLHFLLSTLSSFFMVISIGLNILYSFLYRKYINHIHLLLPSLSIGALLLAWPVFHSCLSLLRCLFVVQWDFCLGVIPAHGLYLSQCNPLHCELFLITACKLQALHGQKVN
jgi:hypothetical protein